MQRGIFSPNYLPARAIAFTLVLAMTISLSLSDLSRANTLSPSITLLNAEFVTIPSELGRIEEFFQGRGNRLVVYIQDAHANYSAQKHIASAIEHFFSQYDIPLVALEAADGEVDVNLFRSFPVPEITEQVLDKRMRTGEIGGPEFALTMSKKNLSAVGIDDEELYLKNFKEFMAVMEVRKEGREFVKNVRTAFESLRSATYSKEHKELDRILEAHRKETLDVMTLMNELEKFSAALKVDIKAFPEIQKLTEIDEKTAQDYMANVDPEALFMDIERLALTLKLKMSGTNTERRLISLEHYLTILERGFELALARRDVKELKDLFKEMRAERIFSFLEKAAAENRVRLGSLNAVRDIPIDSYVEHILNFYQTTVKRDEHFSKALLTEMEKKRASSALMIAGGYHRQGLTERLRKQGISYVVVMPKVDEVSEHEKYLELMKKGANLLHLPSRNALGFAIRAAPGNAMIDLTGSIFNEIFVKVGQPESAAYFQTRGFGSLGKVMEEYTRSGKFVFYSGDRVGDRSLFREMLRRNVSSSAGFGKILERASFSVNISDPSVLSAIQTTQDRILPGLTGFGAEQSFRTESLTDAERRLRRTNLVKDLVTELRASMPARRFGDRFHERRSPILKSLAYEELAARHGLDTSEVRAFLDATGSFLFEAASVVGKGYVDYLVSTASEYQTRIAQIERYGQIWQETTIDQADRASYRHDTGRTELGNTNELLDRFLNLLPIDGPILDVGTGEGHHAHWFSRRGRQVVGIDVSEEQLERARTKVQNVNFIRMGATRLDFADRTFSGIWANNILQHLTANAAKQVLKEFRRVLKPGGVLFLRVEEGIGEYHGGGAAFHEEGFAARYTKLYQRTELATIVKQHGFEVIEIEPFVVTGFPSVKTLHLLARHPSAAGSGFGAGAESSFAENFWVKLFQNELTRFFDDYEASIVIVNPMFVAGYLAGKGLKRRFNNRYIGFNLQKVFGQLLKQMFQVTHSSLHILETFAKRAKLGAEIFEDNSPLAFLGIAVSWFRSFSHAGMVSNGAGTVNLFLRNIQLLNKQYSVSRPSAAGFGAGAELQPSRRDFIRVIAGGILGVLLTTVPVYDEKPTSRKIPDDREMERYENLNSDAKSNLDKLVGDIVRQARHKDRQILGLFETDEWKEVFRVIPSMDSVQHGAGVGGEQIIALDEGTIDWLLSGDLLAQMIAVRALLHEAYHYLHFKNGEMQKRPTDEEEKITRQKSLNFFDETAYTDRGGKIFGILIVQDSRGVPQFEVVDGVERLRSFVNAYRDEIDQNEINAATVREIQKLLTRFSPESEIHKKLSLEIKILTAGFGTAEFLNELAGGRFAKHIRNAAHANYDFIGRVFGLSRPTSIFINWALTYILDVLFWWHSGAVLETSLFMFSPLLVFGVLSAFQTLRHEKIADRRYQHEEKPDSPSWGLVYSWLKMAKSNLTAVIAAFERGRGKEFESFGTKAKFENALLAIDQAENRIISGQIEEEQFRSDRELVSAIRLANRIVPRISEDGLPHEKIPLNFWSGKSPRLRKNASGVAVGFGAANNKEDRKKFPSRREILIGGSMAAAAASLGLGWFVIKRWTTEEWQRFKPEPTLESAKQAVRITIGWLKDHDYRRMDVMNRYLELFEKAESADLKIFGEAPFGKRKRPDGTIQVTVNPVLVKNIYEGIRRTGSEVFFVEQFVGALVQEAWGVETYRVSQNVENAFDQDFEYFKTALHDSALGQTKADLHQFYIDQEDLIRRMAAGELAQEYFEIYKRTQFLRWAQKSGYYSPDRADEAVASFAGDLEMVNAHKKQWQSYELRDHRNLQFAFNVSGILTTFGRAGYTSVTAVVYNSYRQMEMVRFTRSGGKEGIDPKASVFIQQGKLPPLSMLLNATSKITKDVFRIIDDWDQKLDPLQRGFGAATGTRKFVPVWQARAKRVSLGVLSWVAGFAPGLVSTNFATWAGLAAISGCVGGCGYQVSNYLLIRDEKLNSVLNLSPSRIMMVQGKEIQIYEDPDYTFSKIEIDIIQDTLNKMHPARVHALDWIAAISETVEHDTPGFSRDGGIILIMENVPPSNNTPRILVSPETHEKLRAQNKTISTMKTVASNPILLARVVAHELEHVYDADENGVGVGEPLRLLSDSWSDLHQESGEDLDNYAAVNGMTDRPEDRATIAEQWALDSEKTIRDSANLASAGKPIRLKKFLLLMSSLILPDGNIRAYGAPIDDRLKVLDLSLAILNDGWIEVGPFKIKLNNQNNIVHIVEVQENPSGEEIIIGDWSFDEPIGSEFVSKVLQHASGFGSRNINKSSRKVRFGRFTKLSVAALSWFAGIMPGLMGTKLSTWLGLAAISGCVGGCGYNGTPVDWGLHFINVARVRSWGSSQILSVNGHDVAIYDKYPDNLKNFRFSKAEIQIIQDTLEKMKPDDLYKLNWIGAVPDQGSLDLWGEAFGDGFVLIMEDASADDTVARIVIGHEQAEELKRSGKTIASEKASMGFLKLAEVVEHETEHLRDDLLHEPLWEDLHARSGNDLDNYVREYGMTNRREDRATVAEAWVNNSKEWLESALSGVGIGKPMLFEKFLAIMQGRILPNGMLRAYGPHTESFLAAEEWELAVGNDGWIQVGPFRIQLNNSDEIIRIVEIQQNEFVEGKFIAGEWTFDNPVVSEFVGRIMESNVLNVESLEPDFSLDRLTETWFEYSPAALTDAFHAAFQGQTQMLEDVLRTVSRFVNADMGIITGYITHSDGTVETNELEIRVSENNIKIGRWWQLTLNEQGQVVGAARIVFNALTEAEEEYESVSFAPIDSPFVDAVLGSNVGKTYTELSMLLDDYRENYPALDGISNFPFPGVGSVHPDNDSFGFDRSIFSDVFFYLDQEDYFYHTVTFDQSIAIWMTGQYQVWNYISNAWEIVSPHSVILYIPATGSDNRIVIDEEKKIKQVSFTPEGDLAIQYLTGEGEVTRVVGQNGQILSTHETVSVDKPINSGFGTANNKKDRNKLPSRREILIGGSLAAAAASLGLGWFVIKRWTTEEWQRFEIEPTLESAKQAVLITIDWLKNNGFSDSGMLDRYAKAVKEATDVIPPGKQDSVLASMFQKLISSNGKLTVHVNSRRVYKYFRALQKTGSRDLFLEIFGSLIIQEAAGLDAMRVSGVENEEALKVGKRIYVDELRRHFPDGRIEWPSRSMFEFINKYPGEIQVLATIGLAGEFHEMLRRSQFLARAQQKGFYSPEKAEKEFQQLRLKKETADSFDLFNAYRPITKELLAANGGEQEILALVMRQTLSLMLLQLERGEYSAGDWADVSRYGFFAYQEFTRYRATHGAEGVDEKFLGLLQQGKLPPRAMLQNAAQRSLPQVKSLISGWENRLKALEKKSNSGFGVGKVSSLRARKVWRERIKRISVAALSWFAGIMPGLMGTKLSTWLGLAAISGCVGGCGNNIMEYGSPIDWGLHFINVARVRSWGPSQILNVNGHEVAIYDKYPDNLKNFRFSEAEIQVIQDTLEKMKPDDLYKLHWIGAVPDQVDLWGEAFGDGFVLIMENAPEDEAAARIVIGHEQAEELKKAGKTIASEKASMGFPFLAEVIEHETEHLRDNLQHDALWEDLYARSGNDLDNYVREYSMTNRWEDRATVAEAWTNNSRGWLEFAFSRVGMGKTVLFEKFLAIMQGRILPNGMLRAYGSHTESFLSAEEWKLAVGNDGWIRVGDFRFQLNEQNQITNVVGVGENELLGDVITGKWNFDQPVSSPFIEEIVRGEFARVGKLSPDLTLPSIDTAWVSDSLYNFDNALYIASTHRQDPNIPELQSILETMRLFVDSEHGTLRAYERKESGGAAQPRDWKLYVLDADVIRIKTEANEFELYFNANGEIISASFHGPYYGPGYNGEVLDWKYAYAVPIASPFIETVLNSNAERIQTSANSEEVSETPAPVAGDVPEEEIPKPQPVYVNLEDAVHNYPQLAGIDFPFPAVESQNENGQYFNPTGHPFGPPIYRVLINGSETVVSITGMYTDDLYGPPWANNNMYSVVWYRASPEHEPLVFQFHEHIISLEMNKNGELVVHTTSAEPVVLDVKSQSQLVIQEKGAALTADELLAKFPYLSAIASELPQDGTVLPEGNKFKLDGYRVVRRGSKAAVVAGGEARGYDASGNWISRTFYSTVGYVLNVEGNPNEFMVHPFPQARVLEFGINADGELRLDVDFRDPDILIGSDGEILDYTAPHVEQFGSGFGAAAKMNDTNIMPKADENEIIRWNVDILSSREFYESGRSIEHSPVQKNPPWRKYVIQTDDDGRIIGYGDRWRGKGEIFLHEYLNGRISPVRGTDPGLLTLSLMESLGAFSELSREKRAASRPVLLEHPADQASIEKEVAAAEPQIEANRSSVLHASPTGLPAIVEKSEPVGAAGFGLENNLPRVVNDVDVVAKLIAQAESRDMLTQAIAEAENAGLFDSRFGVFDYDALRTLADNPDAAERFDFDHVAVLGFNALSPAEQDNAVKIVSRFWGKADFIRRSVKLFSDKERMQLSASRLLPLFTLRKPADFKGDWTALKTAINEDIQAIPGDVRASVDFIVREAISNLLNVLAIRRTVGMAA